MHFTDKPKMNEDNKTKHNDLMLIGGLLIAALIVFAYFKVIKPHSTETSNDELILEISEDNKILYSSALGDIELPFSYEVSSDGGYNTFTAEELEDGSIGISCADADCPDKVCVETGTISMADEVIVCLPHKVVARLYAPVK